MAQAKTESLARRIVDRLNLYFIDQMYTMDMLEEELDAGDVFYKPADILPFLQTALMDEKFVEVEMNGITQVYFTKVSDDPPEPTDIQGEEETEPEEEYAMGDYLKEMSHLVILPLEPGMGNYSIRYSNRVLLRFFTTAYGVELGTFYQEQDLVGETPVLRLDYPVIGRIVRGSREFRAKVPEKMDIKLMIIGKKKQKTITTRLINISVSGFAFSIKKEQQDDFVVDEVRTMELIINGVMELRVNGNVRHVSKIRGRRGTEYLCGVQADLVTRALAARLEEIVAAVQRAHLRELAKLSDETGINLVK